MDGRDPLFLQVTEFLQATVFLQVNEAQAAAVGTGGLPGTVGGTA